MPTWGAKESGTLTTELWSHTQRVDHLDPGLSNNSS